ncbi:MAG: hypothetical protein QME58_06675 [Bacteroidota bacterium]|nr:hypothetical protein [Bacteroidota bacterium]
MKNLGIITDLYAAPLFQSLKEKPETMNLITDSELHISKLLLEEELDAAFLSPITFARDHDIYSIVPDVCIASEGNSNVVCLYFKERLKEVKTIATDLLNVSEMVLAKLVLTEKYSTTPTFIPTKANIDEMLLKADAALIVGDYNLELLEHKNKLDLVDEWSDLTELPYIHGLWISEKEKLSKEEINILKESAEYGSAHLSEIASHYPPRNTEEVVEFLSAFSYKLNEKAKNGLTEFIRMAYYHEIIEDLPDLNAESDTTLDLAKN